MYIQHQSTGFDGVDVTDTGFAIFEYKNALATAEASSNDVNGYGRRLLLVYGSKGSIEIRPLEGDYNDRPQMMLSLKEMTKNREYTDCKRCIPMPPMSGRYDAMMLEFADLIENKLENPFTYQYELMVQKAVLSACGALEYTKREGEDFVESCTDCGK